MPLRLLDCLPRIPLRLVPLRVPPSRGSAGFFLGERLGDIVRVAGPTARIPSSLAPHPSSERVPRQQEDIALARQMKGTAQQETPSYPV